MMPIDYKSGYREWHPLINGSAEGTGSGGPGTKPFAKSARVSLASFPFPSIQTCTEKVTILINHWKCKSKQEEKDDDCKAVIWPQWAFEHACNFWGSVT